MKNGNINIQTAAYSGARTVIRIEPEKEEDLLDFSENSSPMHCEEILLILCCHSNSTHHHNENENSQTKHSFIVHICMLSIVVTRIIIRVLAIVGHVQCAKMDVHLVSSCYSSKLNPPSSHYQCTI